MWRNDAGERYLKQVLAREPKVVVPIIGQEVHMHSACPRADPARAPQQTHVLVVGLERLRKIRVLEVVVNNIPGSIVGLENPSLFAGEGRILSLHRHKLPGSGSGAPPFLPDHRFIGAAGAIQDALLPDEPHRLHVLCAHGICPVGALNTEGGSWCLLPASGMGCRLHLLHPDLNPARQVVVPPQMRRVRKELAGDRIGQPIPYLVLRSYRLVLREHLTRGAISSPACHRIVNAVSAPVLQ
mmetsp:Transcript_15587/g.33079  ORF Transcript_15587/g.33079 Transcript_15587/m.33079 type:complete len:241 (-) Transcript_15587:1050-1772(-)